jgi:TonB family protein
MEHHYLSGLGDIPLYKSTAKIVVCFENGKLCGHTSIGARIDVDGFVSSDSGSVRLKYDDNQPIRQRWSGSDSHDSLFPYGRENQFLAGLLSHKRLYFEFSKYEEAPQVVTFVIEGLPDAMQKAGLKIPPTTLRSNVSSGVASRGSRTGDAGRFSSAGSGGTVPHAQCNLEPLTDTEGVDFGPYLARVLEALRMNWYNLIPEEARPPQLKRGGVSIEFAILKDGKIAGMQMVAPSGDVSLDRAAWGGITASMPFAPLPAEFHGPYLRLRSHFEYTLMK